MGRCVFVCICAELKHKITLFKHECAENLTFRIIKNILTISADFKRYLYQLNALYWFWQSIQIYGIFFKIMLPLWYGVSHIPTHRYVCSWFCLFIVQYLVKWYIFVQFVAFVYWCVFTYVGAFWRCRYSNFSLLRYDFQTIKMNRKLCELSANSDRHTRIFFVSFRF